MKILQSSKNPIYELIGNGTNPYFLEGTTRVIEKYLFLPHKIGGEWRIGYQKIEQVAEEREKWKGGITITGNKWKNIRFLPKKSLETEILIENN